MNQTIDYSRDELVRNSAYENVRTRRVMAVLVDWLIVLGLCIPVSIVIFFLGLATLGLGFGLYGLMVPAMALLYSGVTMSGREQATVGMRMMDIHVERLDGKPIDFLTAVAHTFLFWAANVVLTPFVLLATLFTDRKRALHDMLTECVVMRGTL
ncbi:MAG: RDD family protein [Rhizobiaceae bacterium]